MFHIPSQVGIGATTFVRPCYGAPTVAELKLMVPRATTFRNMCVDMDNIGSATFTFTARKNGVDTSLGLSVGVGIGTHNITGGGLSAVFAANTDELSIRISASADLSKAIPNITITLSE